jgi:hypothetical protein
MLEMAGDGWDVPFPHKARFQVHFFWESSESARSQHPFPHLFWSLTHSQIHTILLAGQRASSSPFSSVSAALSPGPRLGTYVESFGNHWEEIKEYDYGGVMK